MAGKYYTVSPFGQIEFDVATATYIAISSHQGTTLTYFKSKPGDGHAPDQWILKGTTTNKDEVLAVTTEAQTVLVVASTGPAIVGVDTIASGAIYQLSDPYLGTNQGVFQGDPSTAAASMTATADTLLSGIFIDTSTSTDTLTLLTAADLDTALPGFTAGDSFDFTCAKVGANTLTVATNTGWTLGMTGLYTVSANSTGRFRAKKTGTAAYSLYRL